MAYHHNVSNSCFLNSLVFAFTFSGEEKSARAIEIRIEESLHFQYQGYKASIIFANDIVSDQVENPGDQRLH